MRRELTVADHPALCQLLRDMHAESPWAKYPVAEGRAQFILQRLLETQEGTVYRTGLVDEQGLYGVLLAEVTSHMFMDVLVARDVFFYVHPSRRGNAGAVRGLIRDYERWARENGAKVVGMEISSGIDGNAACGIASGFASPPPE
jgi:GNAT superfamily N-acetyltransferase